MILPLNRSFTIRFLCTRRAGLIYRREFMELTSENDAFADFLATRHVIVEPKTEPGGFGEDQLADVAMFTLYQRL